jgi:putative transposase
MPRRARTRLANVPQIVSLNGHNNEPVLVGPNDYSAFLSIAEESGYANSCDLHAYCLLPTRVVLLCTERTHGNLSTYVQDISRRYVPYFNARNGRSGALWMGRYRTAIVEPSGYVVTAYQFLDSLAVHCGVATHPADHPHSSFNANVSEEPNEMLRPHEMFSTWLENSPAGRHEHHRNCEVGLHAGRAAEVEYAIHHGLVFGTEQFKDRLHNDHGIKVRLGTPGRPRKEQTTIPTPHHRRSRQSGDSATSQTSAWRHVSPAIDDAAISDNHDLHQP